MRKEGETHEHEMTERKGRNEHESERVLPFYCRLELR